MILSWLSLTESCKIVKKLKDSIKKMSSSPEDCQESAFELVSVSLVVCHMVGDVILSRSLCHDLMSGSYSVSHVSTQMLF